MVAVAPESRRCLSSQVTAWRIHLLNLSKKKREEKRLSPRERPIRKIVSRTTIFVQKATKWNNIITHFHKNILMKVVLKMKLPVTNVEKK